MDFNVQTKISLGFHANGISRKHDEHLQLVWDIISDEVESNQRDIRERKRSKNEMFQVYAAKSSNNFKEKSCANILQTIHKCECWRLTENKVKSIRSHQSKPWCPSTQQHQKLEIYIQGRKKILDKFSLETIQDYHHTTICL